ncbi:MAG: aldo/keto reductase [Planctomycetota bacterium]|nr:aldo/keto reductase [Planctomycetota bacterium]
MNLRPLASTGLNVSPICLGTMTFGTPVGEAEAVGLTRWAVDHGINFIDTANMYEGYARTLGSAGGVAEEILGKALAGRREEVVLASKVGMNVGPAPEDEYASPAAIRKQLDKSLRRLATDYVDIYYLHRPDPHTPLPDILGALAEAIQSGKIRHYGISNHSADQLCELLQAADANGLPRPVILQPAYSLLDRGIEKDILPLCEKEGIAVAPYQILQGGLLTGKYRRGESLPVDSRKAEAENWVAELTDELFDRIEQIEIEARAKGRTLFEHAILSVLEVPAIVSAVLGVKRIDQLEAMVRIVDTLEG